LQQAVPFPVAGLLEMAKIAEFRTSARILPWRRSPPRAAEGAPAAVGNTCAAATALRLKRRR
jgi:hypothetical protein